MDHWQDLSHSQDQDSEEADDFKLKAFIWHERPYKELEEDGLDDHDDDSDDVNMSVEKMHPSGCLPAAPIRVKFTQAVNDDNYYYWYYIQLRKNEQ
jgi:hypothetical protein